MQTLRRDLRLAVRNWRRRPLLSAVVVLTLSLGISATTVVFSVIDAVLMAPLPYAAPDRLAVIRAGLPGRQQAIAQLSGPEVLDVVERARTFDEAGAIWARPGVLSTGGDDAAEIEIGWVTPGFMEALGVVPSIGRLPSAEEHQRTDVIVLGYDLWQQRFGGDAAILGRRVVFDDEPRTVVGVMPRGFRMHFSPEDGVPPSIGAWLPWGGGLRQLTRGFRVFTMVARVRDGAAWPAVEAELAAIAAGIAGDGAEYARSGFALSGRPLPDALVAHVRPALAVLSGVVLIVLVVASANVANLLLIRSTERSAEFALRLALGAGSRRLWAQVVTESLLLGIGGGLLGVGLAVAAIVLLGQLAPVGLPRVAEVGVGVRTLAAAGATSVGAALCFGSVAAARALGEARRIGLHGTARGSAPSLAASRVLVAAQLALSVMLLCGAGLLARSMVRLNAIDLGFDPTDVLSARLSLPDVRYPYATAGPAIAELYRRLDERLAGIPGVRGAGATLNPPMSGVPMRPKPYAYRTADGEVEWGSIAADYRTVTPGWFSTMSVRLVSGRLLDARDRWDRPIAVVVDTTLARAAWPDRDPIGQPVRVELFREGAFTPHWGEVVGVVEPLRLTSLVQAGREQIYLAHHQSPQRTMYPAIRTDGDPATFASELRRAVSTLEPGLRLSEVRPASGLVADATSQTRFALAGLGVFAGVAVLIAACGAYAALAASVAQRRIEIGIRLALGASPAAVFRWTMGQGLKVAAMGGIAGLLAAAWTARTIEKLLFGVTPTDAATFIGAAVVLAAVAVLASSLPSARAARVDPCDALRAQ